MTWDGDLGGSLGGGGVIPYVPGIPDALKDIIVYVKRKVKGEANVNGRKKWIENKEANTEKKLEEAIGGEIKPPSEPPRDGCIEREVVDKKTGKLLGYIHFKQPEKGPDNEYTGLIYPKHFHDHSNCMGVGLDKSFHWIIN